MTHFPKLHLEREKRYAKLGVCMFHFLLIGLSLNRHTFDAEKVCLVFPQRRKDLQRIPRHYQTISSGVFPFWFCSGLVLLFSMLKFFHKNPEVTKCIFCSNETKSQLRLNRPPFNTTPSLHQHYSCYHTTCIGWWLHV